MKRYKKTICIGWIGLFVTFSGISMAAPFNLAQFTMEFEEADWFVTPHEAITLEAILTNLSDSVLLGEEIVGVSVSNAFIRDNYELRWGGVESDAVFDQFSGITLAPGESFNFTFLTLVPIADGANTGVYILDSCIGTADSPCVPYGAHTNASITVSPVPLPGTFWMFVFGIFATKFSQPVGAGRILKT